MLSRKTVLTFLAIADCVLMQNELVCFYSSWSPYRNGAGQFLPEDINPFLCTRIIYAFVGLNTDATIRIMDAFVDLEENFGKGGMKKINELKAINTKLKTFIAIGGWTEGSEGFSFVAGSATLRTAFTNNVINFLQKYNFNGLDLDWEYPALRGGMVADKANFVLLLKELKEKLSLGGFLLSASVGAAPQFISTSYNVKEMAKYLDFIHLMSYDYYGAWDERTGFNSPLYESDGKTLNVAESVKVWLQSGAPPSKLILGLPLYGRTYTLQAAYNAGVGEASSGPGQEGRYTMEAGVLSYLEICPLLKQCGWVTIWDDLHEVPFAFNNKTWLSFDNALSLQLKTTYAMRQNLAGVMVWAIDLEDHRGVCGDGKYPLMNRIYSTLNNGAVAIQGTSLTLRGKNSSSTVVTTTTVSKTTTVATTAMTTISTKSPGTSNTFTCSKVGYARDPVNCSVFYYCSFNEGAFMKHSFTCAASLYFDVSILTCNYISNVEC